YTIYGVNHTWGAKIPLVDSWYGPSNSAPFPTVDAGQVYIGDAWNGGTLTGGPGPYVLASKMVMNYNVPASGITNDLTNLNAMGNNPSSYLNGGEVYDSGGSNGDLTLFLEQSGDFPAIGVMPLWEEDALIKYDSNAAPIIFGNARRWLTFPWGLR